MIFQLIHLRFHPTNNRMERVYSRMYISKGSFSRTENFWSFKRKIPSSFYTGDTGIDPLDDSIKKLLNMDTPSY